VNVLYHKEGPVGVITINRPEVKNALNEQVRAELFEALQSANSDQAVRGVILTGGTEFFSAGADIQAMANASAVDVFYRQGLLQVISLMEKMPKPVIAAISGYALGGGCELALGCDLRVATETAVLGQPEIRIGIIPGGGGTVRLARLVGAGRAKDIIFSGRMVDATEAYSIGLVEMLVPVEKLMEESQKKMHSYIRHGGVALGAAKLAVNTGLDMDKYSADLLENSYFALLFATEDQKEGMRAFLEKRKPEFRGR